LPQGTNRKETKIHNTQHTNNRAQHETSRTTHLLSNSPTTSSATTPGTWKPHFLSRLACSSPTTGTPSAEQYSALSTALLDVRPLGRNQDELCGFYCLALTIEG
jgi:hypothetical protein